MLFVSNDAKFVQNSDNLSYQQPSIHISQTFFYLHRIDLRCTRLVIKDPRKAKVVNKQMIIAAGNF